MQLIPWLPLLPLDRRLCIPLVHADDVAEAISRVIEKRAAGPLPCCRTANRTRRCRGRARRAHGSYPLGCARSSRRPELASTAATYRPRLARPGVHRASTGLLPSTRRTRLGPEMVLDGRLGRSAGWRRAPNSRRQSTFAATLDARPSATRRDRGADLIAPAALSAITAAPTVSVGLPSEVDRRACRHRGRDRQRDSKFEDRLRIVALGRLAI